MFKIKVSLGLVLSDGCHKNKQTNKIKTIPSLSPMFCNLLAIFDISYFVDASLQFLPLSSHRILLCISSCSLCSIHVCLCVTIFPWYKDTSYVGLGTS